jgi:hypothetical protein
MKKLITILLLISFASNAQNKSIALKVSSVDTATMLTPYARKYAYVPYTGATGAVDLGANSMSASQYVAVYNSNIPFYAVQGSSVATAYFRNSNEGSCLYVQPSSTSATGVTINAQYGTALNILNGSGSSVFKVDGNGKLTLASTITNGTYTYTLPSATGTLALTSQLNSGTVTNVATNFGLLGGPITTTGTISADTSLLATRLRVQKGIDSLGAAKQPQLNGTGFVKASGTTISYDNSTYLTTSSASSTYLPLAGGTLTGSLYGTRLNVGSATDNTAYLINAKGSGAYNGGILADNTGTTGSGSFQIGVNGVSKGAFATVGLFQGNTDANIAMQSINGFVFFTNGATSGPALQVRTDKTIQMDGALSGTSATFSSGSSSVPALIVGGAGGVGTTLQGQLKFGDGGTVYKIQGGTDYSAMNFVIGTTNVLSLASTGAATFSSSVTATEFHATSNIMSQYYSNVNGYIGLELTGGYATPRTLIGYATDDGTTRFQVNGAGKFSSSISTGIPTGWSAAGAWKLGTKFTTTIALDTTGYITVDIGGTLYYLALASPL